MLLVQEKARPCCNGFWLPYGSSKGGRQICIWTNHQRKDGKQKLFLSKANSLKRGSHALL